MENLWAPWRSNYINTIHEPDRGLCVFCEYAKDNRDRENLILKRNEWVFVIMNKFPYNNGHLMVVPYRHVADPALFTSEEGVELWNTVVECRKALEGALRPQGYNIGMNVGQAAGAGIADHSHAHIVPRWMGDTNFMPIFGQAKVISEDIYKTYDRLKAVLG